MPLKKPKKGWQKYVNLSVRDADYAKLRRMFDMQYKGDLQWIDWLTIALESMVLRYKIINERYPHLRLVSITKNGVIIEDTKENHVVKIGSDLKSEKEDYVNFVLLHPEFRLT